MKILLCPDKFKGSLSALRACNALRKGLLDFDDSLDIRIHPMADGGDGSIDVLQSVFDLTTIRMDTVDALGRKIEAMYYSMADAAYIELASASGLVQLEEEKRNPLLTSTYGTGKMIKDALDRRFRKINLFIGGSATNDGGIGIAQAMGYDFFDENGNQLEPIGKNLGRIYRLENNSPYDFEQIQINVLCDVTNPMYGPNGAAYAYAAQKGGSEKDISYLDTGLRNYAHILKSHLHKDLSDQAGMGAAGGVGASLVGLLHARIKNGFKLLSDMTQLEEAIKNADLVITGEGKLDQTSFRGKVVGNVLALSRQHNTPCGVVCGAMEEMDELATYFRFTKSIMSMAGSINDAMAFPERFLFDIGKDIGSQL